MKVKRLLPFSAIIFSIATLQGQDNMFINLADNSKITVAINDVQQITFDGDNVLLKTVTGTEKSYLLDEIASITFFDEPQNSIKAITKDVKISVYVNAAGEIVVESPYGIKQLSVFDLSGRKQAASAQSNLNVNFLGKGVYLLKVETSKGVISKKITKNR